MNLKKARTLKHGDKVTDNRHIWSVGISPNFPKVLHFWMSQRKYRTIDLNKIEVGDMNFLNPLHKFEPPIKGAEK